MMVEPANKVEDATSNKEHAINMAEQSSHNHSKQTIGDSSHPVGLVTKQIRDEDMEMKEDGVSTPKASGYVEQADVSKAKAGESFLDGNGRRKEIDEEESARYRDVANDNELIDRKFCEAYEHLLPSIKCYMAKCSERGCVLKVFTKDYDYKDTTTTKNRGAVKGTKCGKSATFGTCLQQWFGLGILDDLSRQAKARETLISPATPEQTEEEKMKADQRGRNDRAIALIAESVTRTLDQAEALTRQAEAQRLAFVKEIEKLKANAIRMQQALAEALRRRDAGENFDLPDVPKMDKVIAPAAHTAAYNPAPPTQMTDAPPQS